MNKNALLAERIKSATAVVMQLLGLATTLDGPQRVLLEKAIGLLCDQYEGYNSYPSRDSE